MNRFYSEALGIHERAAFASGNARIDTHFEQTVTQDMKRGYAACYLLVEKASAKIAGFYNLSSHTIPLTELAPELTRKLPCYATVPAVLIGWLGRDVAFRGQQVGSMLLADAIARLAASPVGVHAICADAKMSKARPDGLSESTCPDPIATPHLYASTFQDFPDRYRPCRPCPILGSASAPKAERKHAVRPEQALPRRTADTGRPRGSKRSSPRQRFASTSEFPWPRWMGRHA